MKSKTIYTLFPLKVSKISSKVQNLLNWILDPKVTYKSVGKTYEGREIPAIVVTNKNGTDKKAIFFECG